MNDFTNFFSENGYAIAPAADQEALTAIREALFSQAKQLLSADDNDAEQFFDSFHTRGIEDSALNEFRVKLISNFNKSLDVGDCALRAFENILLQLTGPDIVVQRNVNLVIHLPHDTSVSPAHRDAPPNSLHEVVVWIPLNHCYGTKGMNVLPCSMSEKAADLLDKTPPAYEEFKVLAEKSGTPVDIKFGEALFFWTGLFHYIPVNKENETRWSLNLRFKNAFSPYGTKGLPDYFQIASLSPISKLALERQKREDIAT